MKVNKDHILIPKFCGSDCYTISMARDKNSRNKCGFKGCENDLPEPDKDYIYYGVKICLEHAWRLEKERLEIVGQADEQFLKMINITRN